MDPSFLQRLFEEGRADDLTRWLILTLNSSVSTPARHVDAATVDRNFLELRVLCSNAGSPDPKLDVVRIPNLTPAFLATLRLNDSKLCTYPRIFSTAEAAMNHIVLEGILSMNGQRMSESFLSKIKRLNSSEEEDMTDGEPDERPGKATRIVVKLNPLERWDEDITTVAWNGSGDYEEQLSSSFENDTEHFETDPLVFRQRGFKRIRCVNFEADGHVIVQVLESSFKLYEDTKFEFDETQPATDLRPDRFYFARVDFIDQETYGTRAEYRGESDDADKVLMYFPDFGCTTPVRREHVLELNNYPDVARIPIQAVRVSVAGLTNMGYSVEQLLSALDKWTSSGETVYMMRAKLSRREKFLERSTGVPKVLIINREGHVLGVWKR